MLDKHHGGNLEERISSTFPCRGYLALLHLIQGRIPLVRKYINGSHTGYLLAAEEATVSSSKGKSQMTFASFLNDGSRLYLSIKYMGMNKKHN